MGRPVLAEYERLLEAAFRQPRGPDGDSHSVIGNLETVPPEAWEWLPDGADRSVRDVVLHIGGSLYLYEAAAFGPRLLGWEEPPAVPAGGRASPRDELLDWLVESHERFLAAIAVLQDDADLERRVKAPWGEQVDVRFVLTAMLQHSHYHAGEINHLRSLHARTDRWAWEQGQGAA